MTKTSYHLDIGLSDYAITAYLSLLKSHPANGSQLSRRSGIPRARIYDVLRTLKQKGFVAELSEGLYLPLPPDEMIRRLRRDHEADLTTLESILAEAQHAPSEDFIWTLKGYDRVMAKAKEMIDQAETEIYLRAYQVEGRILHQCLKQADARGVPVKYITMEPTEQRFPLQVVHPEHETIEQALGGRTFDLVVDRKEILGGMFIAGREDHCVINWGRNPWFVLAGRDSLRHDFFHYFLYRTYQMKQTLSEWEESLYHLILEDL